MTSEGPSVGTTGPSFIWYFDDSGGHEARAFAVGGDRSPYVGDFDADGCHDIAWLDAVDDTLHVWRCLPAMRDFDCGAEMPTPPNAAPVGMHWGFEMLGSSQASMSRYDRWQASAKSKIVAACIVLLVAACGPEVDEDAPPGFLEYEHPEARLYRLDRRVDIVPFDLDLRPRECGYLTDRAYYDIVETIDSLDPSVDYNDYLCRPVYNPKDRVHIEGFEHSPFFCDWNCCHPDLFPISTAYFAFENNFVGLEPVVNDVPYVALEPDRPCEQ